MSIEEFLNINAANLAADIARSVDQPLQMTNLINELLVHAHHFVADSREHQHPSQSPPQIHMGDVQDAELRGVVPTELRNLSIGIPLSNWVESQPPPIWMQNALSLLLNRVQQLFSAGTVRSRTLENWCSVALFWARAQLQQPNNNNIVAERPLSFQEMVSILTHRMATTELARTSLQRYVSNTNALIRVVPSLFGPDVSPFRSKDVPYASAAAANCTVTDSKISRTDPPRVFLTESELDRIQYFITMAASTVFDTRDILLFHLVRYTGLRVGGIRNLRVCHCWHRGEQRPRNRWLTTEKGGVQRTFLAPLPLQNALSEYMRDPSGPPHRRRCARFVFAAHRNVCCRTNKQSVQETLTRMAIFAGVDENKRVTAHSIRRSVVSQLMHSNTILQVADWIGHRTIDTTFQRYWRLSTTEIASRMHMPFLRTHIASSDDAARTVKSDESPASDVFVAHRCMPSVAAAGAVHSNSNTVSCTPKHDDTMLRRKIELAKMILARRQKI